MQKKQVFTLSENHSLEYSCTIVKIGELNNIEGSDFLQVTMVNGNPLVVDKSIKEGDIMIYCPIETALNKEFLSVNNLFELSERQLNANFKEVEDLIISGDKDEAKKRVGFFNKHGRVRIIRLRGCPSMGFLCSTSSLINWDKSLEGINFEEYIGTDFDTINGKLFVHVYVPELPKQREHRRLTKQERDTKKLRKFSRLVPGQFEFHYSTSQLQRNMFKLNPSDNVTISLKVHGTSFCCANVLTRKKIVLSKGAMLLNKILKHNISKSRKNQRTFNKQIVQQKIANLKKKIYNDVKIEYGNLYSSRKVIKNSNINPNVKQGYYSVDIWGVYNDIIKPYIDEGMILYGEIVGYLNHDANKMIQKNYDYGCNVGESFLMPYRITTTNKDGSKKEWNVMEVYEWTNNLVNKHKELKKVIKPIFILYHGKIGDLYPDLPTSIHWHDNLLEKLRNDTEHFGMELNEPLCKHKVPREGIVLRIDDDPICEAFKLKTFAFLNQEAKLIDKGEVDIEMEEAY